MCANRIYVQEGVYEAFVQKFAAKVETMKVGNGFEEGVVQGPLVEPATVEKVQRHLEDAQAKGAKIVTGVQKLQGQFFQPTVADATSVKQSGLGREGSHHGIDEYVEMKYLCMGDVLN